MKFVATKTADQLDLQALHRVRERLVSQRTGIIDQIRAFLLERGVAVRQGLRFLRAELPAHPGYTAGCAVAWHGADHRGSGWRLAPARRADREKSIGRDRGCCAPGCRLRTADERALGVRPIISSAMVATIGTGDVFSKGRDFAAWLGLVPRQMSTGDRTILGEISKRGNRYLRVLFVQAAWVVLIKP